MLSNIGNTLTTVRTSVESSTMKDDQSSVVFRLRWGTTVSEKQFSTMIINRSTGHIRMPQDRVVLRANSKAYNAKTYKREDYLWNPRMAA